MSTSWSKSRYRTKSIPRTVIGISLGYQRDLLLARGFGLEHLREMLVRIARPILRQGASLAYGGYWKDVEDNFTFDLLRLIAAEQEDNSLGGPDTDLEIGRLYNHCQWPYYLDVTPQLEAKWINCARVIRVTQRDAGFSEGEIVADSEANDKSPRVEFNKAVTLSVMRRWMPKERTLKIPEGASEIIPPVVSRIAFGGRLRDYAGFMPGIFEEALTTVEAGSSLYLLGGFGGATEVLARAILNPRSPRPAELTVNWHRQHSKAFENLWNSRNQFVLPSSLPGISRGLDLVWSLVKKARSNPAKVLRTGLTDKDTRELFSTRDMDVAVRLVLRGHKKNCNLKDLPA